MRFALFGSRIIDDAAVRIKDSGHNDVNRIVGISPFSANCSFLDSNIIAQNELVENNEYRSRITCWDINKTIYSELASSECNYICIDFGCAQEHLLECYFDNGQSFRVTYTQTVRNNISLIRKKLEAFTKKKIKREKEIDPLTWKDSELEKEIDYLVGLLKKSMGDKKIVLLIPQCAFQYEDNGKLVNSDDYKRIALINDFIEKCSFYFEKKTDCVVIHSSEFILGGDMYNSYEGMSYSTEYYEYINRCLRTIDEKNVLSDTEEKEALKIYEKTLQEKVDLMLLPDMFIAIKSEIKGRKLIVIGGFPEYEERLRNDYHQEVAFSIPYDRAVNNGELCSELSAAMEEKEKYVCIITHMKPGGNIVELLWNNGDGFAPFHSCFTVVHDTIILRDLIGRYFDVFHNRASCKSAYTRIVLLGSGSSVELLESSQTPYNMRVHVRNQSQVRVGKNVRADRLSIGFFDSCSCSIGNDCSFASNCALLSCDFMSVEIGDDCMFSNNIVVHAGDGHAIFDAGTGDRINYDMNKGEAKFRIKLNNHIWVGYESFILAGADIGAGCVIGGRSLVNRQVPNNCVLAGNPARIVKEDIAWTRDPFTQNVFNEAVLDSAYMQMTDR